MSLFPDRNNPYPVLDLKAVEAEARHIEAGIYPARAVMLAEKTLALLALLRETRAALKEVEYGGVAYDMKGSVFSACSWCHQVKPAHRGDCGLAAVLAKARDDP